MGCLANPNKLLVQPVSSKYPWSDIEDLVQHKGSYSVTSLNHAFPILKGGLGGVSVAFGLITGGAIGYWHGRWMP